jgi:hypothetical protein
LIHMESSVLLTQKVSFVKITFRSSLSMVGRNRLFN